MCMQQALILYLTLDSKTSFTLTIYATISHRNLFFNTPNALSIVALVDA